MLSQSTNMIHDDSPLIIQHYPSHQMVRKIVKQFDHVATTTQQDQHVRMNISEYYTNKVCDLYACMKGLLLDRELNEQYELKKSLESTNKQKWWEFITRLRWDCEFRCHIFYEQIN